MTARILIRCSLTMVCLACLGLMGCSADSDRVISPATSVQSDLLSTSTVWPDSGLDAEEYISQGYYYPEEDQDECDTSTRGNPDDRFNNDNPSRKPKDRGGS